MAQLREVQGDIFHAAASAADAVAVWLLLMLHTEESLTGRWQLTARNMF